MIIVFLGKKPGQRQKKKRREQRLNSIKKKRAEARFLMWDCSYSIMTNEVYVSKRVQSTEFR